MNNTILMINIFILIFRCWKGTEKSRNQFPLETEEWMKMISKHVTRGATNLSLTNKKFKANMVYF